MVEVSGRRGRPTSSARARREPTSGAAVAAARPAGLSGGLPRTTTQTLPAPTKPVCCSLPPAESAKADKGGLGVSSRRARAGRSLRGGGAPSDESSKHLE